MADPQDLRSEEALLGAILVAPKKTKTVQVKPEEFYRESHGLIWDAAVKCANNGGADAITVSAELERRGQLKDVGGRDKLQSLAASVPTPGNAGAYAKRVKELALLRTQRRSAQRILEAIDNEELGAVAKVVESLGNPILYVDTGSGEVVESCPACTESTALVQKMEHQRRADLRKLSVLEGKAERKAREHKRWGEIEAVFDWYRLATGHFGVTFTIDEFNQALPRFKQYGKGKANPCKPALKAICGIAFDPSTTKGRNGQLRRFDKFELVNRNQFSWADLHSRCPRAVGHDENCECAKCENRWWHCLLSMIEANLKP